MTHHFTVPTLLCSACADAVIRAIQSQDSQAQVNVNLETKAVTLQSHLSETLIRQAVESAGHELADFS
jgi:copper chaperone